MRDILVLLVVAAVIPLSLYNPFYGLLGFSWLAYMRPQDLSWGLARGLPLSKWVALAIYASLLLRGRLNVFRASRVTIAMVVLWLWLIVTSFLAQHTDIALAKLSDITKVFLIAFITVTLVSTEKRFRISMLVIGVSLGLLGVKYGVFGLARGGVHIIRGVGGMIGDNNDFALALNMAVPILLFSFNQATRRWMRLGIAALIPLTVMTVLFTDSRGGFLSLCAITLFLVWNSRRKLAVTIGVAALAVMAGMLLPSSFWERMTTIVHYQNDGSAMGRLNAWQAAWSMSKDYPVFGVGLDNFLFMFRYYAPDPEDVHVAHNTWLQMLAETGFTGLAIYVTMILMAFTTLWSARRKARRYGIQWGADAAKYLEASLIAFVVGATFLNRAHFDLTYHVIVLSVCVQRIVNYEVDVMRDEAREGVREVRAA